jgi:hypothetical protein
MYSMQDPKTNILQLSEGTQLIYEDIEFFFTFNILIQEQDCSFFIMSGIYIHILFASRHVITVIFIFRLR